LQIIKRFESEKDFPNSYLVLGQNPAGNRVRPSSHFPFPTPARPSRNWPAPANSRARANGPACPYRHPPRSQPKTNQSEAATPCSLRNPHQIRTASQSPGRPPDDREPEGRSPTVASPRRHPPLPPSKQNEFPTSLRFFRRRWHLKQTTVARDRRNSDEHGQPAKEHRRSARWRRRPLPNLICIVHHKPSG
jgi:hypothetical protein